MMPIFIPTNFGRGGFATANGIARRILRDFKLESTEPKKLMELAWAIRQIHPQHATAEKVFLKIGIALAIINPIAALCWSVTHERDQFYWVWAPLMTLLATAMAEMLLAGAFYGLRYIFTGREWP